MLTREVVVAALQQSVGLMDRPHLAKSVLRGDDIRLEELDIDSLSTYEVILHIEEAFDVEIPPSSVIASETLSDLIQAVDEIRNLRQ